jgi:hypothetical protein
MGDLSARRRKFRALDSVRRLIVTGNNKRYWRQRERDILAAIEQLDRKDHPHA